MTSEELTKRFTYHPVKGDQEQRYVHIRTESGRLAQIITDLTPESREQAIAFTKLEEVVMWANAAIARNE